MDLSDWLSPSARQKLDPFAPFNDHKHLLTQIKKQQSSLSQQKFNLNGWENSLKRFRLSNQAQRNFTDIKNGKATIVITGQQPGLLLGPAYTIYKALSAISICHWLKKQDIEARPVFWVASEDHDLHEILNTKKIHLNGHIQKLSANFNPNDKRASEILPWTPELDELLQEHLPDWLQSKWSKPKSPRETYSDHFIELLLHLFDKEGLLPIEPKYLSGHDQPYWKQIELKASALVEAFEQDDQNLLNKNINLQVHRRYPLPIFALNQKTGQRQPLTWSPKGWKRDSLAKPFYQFDKLLSPEERFSPGALLRPTYAQAHLPILISVLGPGEWLYHQQNIKAFNVLKQPRPILWPRLSVSFIESDMQQWMSKHSISKNNFLSKTWTPETDIPPHISDQWNSIVSEFFKLKQSLHHHHPGLNFNDIERNWDFSLKKIQQRYLNAELKRKGLSPLEVNRIRNFLFPNFENQERTQGGLFLLSKPNLFDALKKALNDPFDFSMREILF